MSLESRIKELSERHKRLEAAIAAEMKHPAGDDVQAPGEAQQRGDLRPSRADGVDDETTQFVLHLGCHRHRSSPLAPSGRRTRPGCHPGSAAAGLTVDAVAVGV